MRVADFDFQLPKSLIAQYPYTKRSACRLMTLNGLNGTISHGIFTDLLKKLNRGDLLVLNNTRVIPARIFGYKISGGKIEILVERILNKDTVLAHVRSSRVLKKNSEIILGQKNSVRATLIARHNQLFEIKFNDERTVLEILISVGNIPLPSYIKRSNKKVDYEFYQTVYSHKLGAIAAPTAGLHFDQPLLDAISNKGIKIVFITLHIGAGTFQPIRVDNIQDHIMHEEYVEVSQDVVDAVLACKSRGDRVVAVGTTSVRSLESAAKFHDKNLLMTPFLGNTNIFIFPGYRYKLIDALVTNFHLPKSTLIMLIAAFAGYKHTMEAYKIAIAKKYHFFSYGDAMFITGNPKACSKLST